MFLDLLAVKVHRLLRVEKLRREARASRARAERGNRHYRCCGAKDKVGAASEESNDDNAQNGICDFLHRFFVGISQKIRSFSVSSNNRGVKPCEGWEPFTLFRAGSSQGCFHSGPVTS